MGAEGNAILRFRPPHGDAQGGFAYDPTVFNQAMAAQQQAPQPVIVVGPDSGTTMATQSSYGTVVTKFGGAAASTSRP
jgi:hypothetical protein